jgi:hypothetical protein
LPPESSGSTHVAQPPAIIDVFDPAFALQLLQAGALQVPPEGARRGQRGSGLLLSEDDTDEFGAPGGVLAAELTDLRDDIGGGLGGLVPAAAVIVGGQAGCAVLVKAGKQTADGADGQPELPSHDSGLGVLLPVRKKATGGWVRA